MRYTDPQMIGAGESVETGKVVKAFKVVGGDINVTATSAENSTAADLTSVRFIEGDFIVDDFSAFAVDAGSAGEARAYRKRIRD